MPETDSHAISQLTQQALARSEALLRIASRIGRMGGWELDIAHGRIFWSEETRKIHEVPADWMPTLEQALEFYHPQDRDAVRFAVERCIEDGTPYDQELRFHTAKGREIWVRVIGEAVRGEDGTVVALHGAIQDITERKETEHSLRATEERFRQFANKMPFLMWTADAEGNADFSNRFLLEYTGVDPGLTMAERWRSMVHPDDFEPCAARWTHALATGQPHAMEIRIRRADGTFRWFHLQASLTRDADGKPLRWYGSAVEIHQMKEATQQATALAQRLQTTLESITDAFYVLDRQWRFTYLNATAEKYLERSAKDLTEKSVWEEFPGTIGTILEHEFRRAMQRQQTTEFQMFYEPLKRWFDVTAYPSDEGLAVYFQDVTQRLQAEEQLRLLDTCVASVNEFVVITEANATAEDWPRVVFVNDALLRHTGFSREEMLSQSAGILHGPETQADVLDRIRIAIDRKQAISEELINYTKTGEPFWCELNLAPVANSTGQVTHIIAIARDITERKWAEQQLRESEERFRFLSEATSDAIWDWDLTTNDLWLSAGFEKLWGRSFTQTVVDVKQWQDHIHPDDRDQVLAGIRQAIEEGGLCWSAEYRFLRQDGSCAYVLDRASIIHDAQGRPIRMVGGMTDQTIRKQTEKEIRRLNEVLEERVQQRTAELQAANKELEAFSYSVSHDLLSPLRGIDSFSLIVLEDYAAKLDDEGCRLLNIIRNEAQRMAQLIHDLLNFARTGRQPILEPIRKLPFAETPVVVTLYAPRSNGVCDDQQRTKTVSQRPDRSAVGNCQRTDS
jgi:PAS domain S-box-containing protein